MDLIVSISSIEVYNVKFIVLFEIKSSETA